MQTKWCWDRAPHCQLQQRAIIRMAAVALMLAMRLQGESKTYREHSASDIKHRECGECQQLRGRLYEEQQKPRVFHSECVQCQSKREAKIMDAKQSLHYMMYSGESFGSRYLLAALAAKKMSVIATTSSKQM